MLPSLSVPHSSGYPCAESRLTAVARLRLFGMGTDYLSVFSVSIKLLLLLTAFVAGVIWRIGAQLKKVSIDADVIMGAVNELGFSR